MSGLRTFRIDFRGLASANLMLLQRVRNELRYAPIDLELVELRALEKLEGMLTSIDNIYKETV